MAFDDYLGAERARMAAQQPKAPAYQFRDDRNAQLDRDQSATTAAMGTAAKAAGPFAPAKAGTGFDSFSSDLEAGGAAPKASGNNPFAPADTKAQVSGAISRLLTNPTGGFDQSAALARQKAVTGNQVANEDLRSQAALAFMPGTGQGFTPMQQQSDQQILAMRDFDARIAGDRATAETQGLQTGAGLGLQQEGQRISAEQAARQLAETSRQFNETLPIQAAQARAAAELGQGQLGVQQGQLALSEKLGTADLSLREKALSQTSSQFQDEISFKKDALAKGYTDAEAQRAWQAGQNAAQLASSEKIAMADLSVRERQLAQSASQFQDELAFKKDATAKGFQESEIQRSWQAAQNEKAQTFQAGESAKDREAARAQFYDQLGLSKEKLAFDKEIGLANLTIAQQQVANQASQFASAQDFQKYALEKGLDADQAKLAWQSNENEATRKFTSGERLSSQEFTTLINKNNQDFEAAQNSLSRTLQLDVQGNAQKFEAAQTAAAQAYDLAKTDKAMSHEDALAASQQAFTKSMQEAGFSNEQTLQAAQLAQQANIAKQQMDLQETMHMADLAQTDKQFGERMGLDYTQMGIQADQFRTQLDRQSEQWAADYGLDKAKLDSALASEDFANALQRAQIGMELTKNNPEAMKPFAEQMASTLGKALGFTPEQIAAGIKSGALMPATTPVNTSGTGFTFSPNEAAEVNIRNLPVGASNVDAFLKTNPHGMVNVGNAIYQVQSGGSQGNRDYTVVKDSTGATKYIYDGAAHDALPTKAAVPVPPRRT